MEKAEEKAERGAEKESRKKFRREGITEWNTIKIWGGWLWLAKVQYRSKEDSVNIHTSGANGWIQSMEED